MTQPCSPHLYNALSYRQRFAAGFVAVLFASALTACGGGGSGSSGGGGSSYKGKSDPTDITQENSEALGEAAIQGSGAAIDEDSSTDSIPMAAKTAATQITLSDERRDWLAVLHQQVIDQAGGFPETSSAINVSVDGDCGGSAVTGFNGENTVIRYNSFCSADADGDTIINGTVYISSSNSNTVIRYKNFTVESGGEVTRINDMTITCDDNGCITSSDFIGANGVTYRMQNIEIDENAGVYDVSASISHPEHGSVTFEAVGLVACAEGGFSAGTITVTSTVPNATGEVVVTFNHDCTANIDYLTLLL